MTPRTRHAVPIPGPRRPGRSGARPAPGAPVPRRAAARVGLVGAVAALGVLAVLGPAAAAHAAAGPWHENPQSRVRLITPYAVAPAAGEIRLGLQFTAIPGWHLYWKNSGDAGYRPAVDFSPTPEVHDAELLWPAPGALRAARRSGRLRLSARGGLSDPRAAADGR